MPKLKITYNLLILLVSGAIIIILKIFFHSYVFFIKNPHRFLINYGVKILVISFYILNLLR